MEQTPRSGPRVSEIGQKLGVRVRENGWKIVASHAKNTSNPDQFSSGLCPGASNGWDALTPTQSAFL
jgi:hypothetical protein